MASTATNEVETDPAGGDPAASATASAASAARAAAGRGPAAALARKLSAAKAGASTTERTALRALRLAAARTADDLFDLPVAAIGATQDRCMIDDLRRHFSDNWLLVLLDGPDGRFGMASFDPSAVMVLIQQQTMGEVTGGTPSDRPFTDTDAALAEPLIEGILSRAADLAEVEHDRRCLTGYRFGARAADVQDLVLALEDDRYRVFDLTLDIAHGKVQSVVRFALPDLTEEEQGEEAAGPRGPHLDQAAGVIRAELTAVLGRIRMPLSRFARLAPGMLLELTDGDLARTELRTIAGGKVAVARLGQAGGMRALRMNEPPELRARPDPGEAFEPAGPASVGGFGMGGAMAGAMDGLPPMGGFSAGAGMAFGDDGDGAGDLPAWGADAEADDLPPPGGDAGFSDLPAFGGDDDGGLPPLGGGDGLPPLEGDGDLSDLPPLGGEDDLPDLPMGTPMSMDLGDLGDD
ncbi:FliM/FliN family flagellar motor C-terminal domain-containing protein [Chachezhania sediminis]|uniref:FliM/FliN family flagellar motor C-terminal domain-containing protein n=1 Tax=Chachezhania sediminis TaxID=2599291 RepID=UPI00131D3713|nr:FliM/FliN family flagellar motor C-terminal domain-containing protein [Chachezhania sediminis]